ncbi:flavin reductase (DIM6/NTAB) family NADH-FMN oxidoreductase RutF [Allocatelliglobosispora scoriae]|uniref:Flavin reductase (DIM6/NTAB) family NADH-FMN oxidoreductase RutF n=1 Tax=Allocatelliglobosispora scoriae TaxID=643052 RepID=A0A841BRJ7_9ACTN|nr:flavin reductase family protein [Allocatelliglobosispora scoriae]MBB5870864.1 flavin reductase (DIM6/NTAB) family NADH-FMN oxidoreductase RutF [Allocatelliglobosispora scoriae]
MTDRSRLLRVRAGYAQVVSQPGGEIHGTDPFATPHELRSPIRQLRGRFASGVALWTAPGPAGFTVSSTVVVDGDPGRLLGIVDDESELWDAIESAGVFAVTPLGPGDRQLADRFAGLMPAPGGLFRDPIWTPTEFGPVPTAASTWAGCRLDEARPFGWGLLIEATIMATTIGSGDEPLVHYRGRYRELG